MKGSRWESLKNCKAQDTASPASPQPSSTAHQSTIYSAKHLIKSHDYPLQVQHEGYGLEIHIVSCLCKATGSKKNKSLGISNI